MNKETQNTVDALRRDVIIKFLPVAALVLIVFILMDFFIFYDLIIGLIHSASLILLVVLIPYINKTDNIVLASNILPALGFISIMPWLFTGGLLKIGFWWSIVYVVGVFLVTEKKWAIFWLTFYFLFSSVVVVLSLGGFVEIAYNLPELLNLFFAFIITFVFIYVFNQVREHYMDLANAQARDLVRLNNDLSIANSELEQFVYLASHDLQEPLRTISNFIGLLEKENLGKFDKDSDQYINFIVGANTKMQTLIWNLLDLSRTGRNFEFEKVDCNLLLKEVISEMDASIKNSYSTIKSTELPILVGCKIELKRLFQNLLSNAIKFQKAGSKPDIHISVEQNDAEYTFAMKDNGIGMVPELTNKIFIIFQRLHSENEYPGTGIGLAICKKIVQLHKGKIWVDSIPDKGSIFYYTISKEIQSLS